MGIPSYFSKIIRDNPGLLHIKTPKVDAIYLDFNGCIHNCANALGEKCDETSVISAVLLYIDKIYMTVSPTKFMGIYIDGIPPYAKIIQQRNRRYMSMWRENRLGIIENSKKWNSVCISPGTQFMVKLEAIIRQYLSKYKGVIETELSGSDERGEGEHKIFTRIKYESCIIYGLDADLIMLSLHKYDKSDTCIYLMREPVHLPVRIIKEAEFIYLSISEFSKDIQNKYDIAISEYVAVCFILGNDFIPHTYSIAIKSDGIAKLLTYYRGLKGPILIIDKLTDIYKWNIDNLREFINLLSKNEESELKEVANKYFTQEYKYYGKNADEIKIEKIDNYPAIYKLEDKINIGEKGWNNRWYSILFRGERCDVICNNYIESLQFTLDYYMNSKVSDTRLWYYRYSYAPLFMDVYNYMQTIKTMPNNLSGQNMEIDIELQHRIIIPIAYKKYMRNPKITPLHYFPVDFSISTYLKRRLYECVPILPTIDITNF